jgi:type II restriction enzyme
MFSTEDTYVLASRLKKLHPRNHHVEEKIRQQLQVLRDLGLLTHVSKGVWRLSI